MQALKEDATGSPPLAVASNPIEFPHVRALIEAIIGEDRIPDREKRHLVESVIVRSHEITPPAARILKGVMSSTCLTIREKDRALDDLLSLSAAMDVVARMFAFFDDGGERERTLLEMSLPRARRDLQRLRTEMD